LTGSLPSRDYYTEAKFVDQRATFKDHLKKVAAIVSPVVSLKDGDEFADRVLRFETKLAQIEMKPDQCRQYAEYFTVTTLDDFMTNVNDLKSLDEKMNNYSNAKIEKNPSSNPDDEVLSPPDDEVLSSPTYFLNGDNYTDFKRFVPALYEVLNLKSTLETNYEKHYPNEENENATRSMVVFDGDFFRRVFPLILSVSNIPDLVAYMQYNVIKWGCSHCTWVHCLLCACSTCFFSAVHSVDSRQVDSTALDAGSRQ
tara:strand:+ start:2492 stop:3256 length:765 start_codon:yes stop_codon:yes gene_type:complete